jgi:hypothetical protein
LFSVKNANFFAEFFGENILKIITLVTLVRSQEAAVIQLHHETVVRGFTSHSAESIFFQTRPKGQPTFDPQ